MIATHRPASGKLSALQMLRAVAATVVVIAHVRYDFVRHLGLDEALPPIVDLGTAGVDLFFVISGFVMVYSSESLFGRDGAAKIFLIRRVARIVPLYWLLCAVAVVYDLARGFAAADTSSQHAVLSFLFIPAARPSGEVSPIYGVGWTLNYEMFFYALFATCLAARREATAACVALVLVALTIAGAAAPSLPWPLAYWVNPIVLEFAFGMMLAVGYRRGVRLPNWMAAVLAVAALALTLDQDILRGMPRWVVYGMPAAMAVAAFTWAKRDIAIGWIDSLGDASYALYLCHPVVIVVARMLSLRGYLVPAAMPWVYLAGVVVASIAVALLLHRLVEVPLTARSRQLLAAMLTPPKQTRPSIS